MKKKTNRKLVVELIALAAVVVCAGIALIWKLDVRDKTNLFAYAIDLENENWAYAPKGLDYGMTAEDVIKAERLKDYIWEEEGEILRTEKTVKKLFGEIKEFEFVKRYFFDSEGGLTSVRYELVMGASYAEYIRPLLYEQALEYMPENNSKTDLGEVIDLTYGERVYPFMGPWNRMVVWEDTTYESDAEDSVLSHANSDVVLRVNGPELVPYDEVVENETMEVSLIVSCYKDRLTEAQIIERRKEYPVCDVILNLENWLLASPAPEQSYEQYVRSAETLAHAQILGGLKMDRRGVSDRYNCGEYEMIILADAENICKTGERFKFAYNMDMVEREVNLTDGMEVVVPIRKTDREDTKWEAFLDVAYYVTEDGYVLSTFDENEELGVLGYRVKECSLSGMTLEDFLRKFKK